MPLHSTRALNKLSLYGLKNNDNQTCLLVVLFYKQKLICLNNEDREFQMVLKALVNTKY